MNNEQNVVYCIFLVGYALNGIPFVITVSIIDQVNYFINVKMSIKFDSSSGNVHKVHELTFRYVIMVRFLSIFPD